MHLTAEGFDLEAEIGVKAHARRLRTTALPIVYGERLGEKKLHPWRDGGHILLRILTLAVHDHRREAEGERREHSSDFRLPPEEP